MKRLLTLSSWMGIGFVVSCVAIVAGSITMEMKLREAAVSAAEDRTAMMAASLAQQAADTFQIADLALSSLGRLIGENTPTTKELGRLRIDMTEMLRRVPRLSSLSYYEQSGWRLATSENESFESSSNQARAAFFRHHRRYPGNDVFVGPPVRLEASGEWMVTASRRVSHPDGGFDGVLVATMKSSYFSDLYTSFETDELARVTLIGSSGELLARNPYIDSQIGMDLSDTAVFRQIRNGVVSGVRRDVSPIDGMDRIASFRRLPGRPMAVIYSVTRATALGRWREGLPYRMGVLAAILAVVAGGGARLTQYARARQISEQNLLQMSRTDALTGLLNRRAFDEALPIEWMRCVASGKPLSILMIDVDHFKAFNDTYGHQAGDACLRAIAEAIAISLRYPRDRVMRYGGEEMTALLPETAETEAHAVAERMRAGVASLLIRHSGSPEGFVTVSIGHSTEDRHSAPWSSAAGLLADADRSLYKAKASGRNRTVGGGRAASLAAEPLPAQTERIGMS